jgi:hypothetical protein
MKPGINVSQKSPLGRYLEVLPTCIFLRKEVPITSYCLKLRKEYSLDMLDLDTEYGIRSIRK